MSSAQRQGQIAHQDDQVAIVGEPVQVVREDEKIPLFLIKLWNIVEDPSYQKIVHWDDSGYSFHIVDPYSFCRNVLPHYFKHNNLNSLIRQLNMYGFRKMTPLDRSGLTRAESDQDHLEFSHPYFVRDHPELLINIKRKSSNRNEGGSSAQQSQTHHLESVSDELRSLREKQRSMDTKMASLVKENVGMWEQISHMRTQHENQKKVVEKLVQFLVALVGPSAKGRIPRKRGMLALDEAPTKRTRSSSAQYSTNQVNVLSDVLDNLHKQLSEGNFRRSGGPIIADITEEFSTVVEEAATPPDYMRHSSPYSASCGSSSSTTQMNIVKEQGDYEEDDEEDAASTSAAATGTSCGSSSGRYLSDGLGSGGVGGSSSSTEDGGCGGWLKEPVTLNRTLPPPASPSSFKSITPSIEHSWGHEIQEYLNGNDQNINNCRDLIGRDLGNFQWDLDGTELDLDDWMGEHGGQLLALEAGDTLDNEGALLESGEQQQQLASTPSPRHAEPPL